MNARSRSRRHRGLLLGSLLLGSILTAPVLAGTTAPRYDLNGNLTSQTTSRGTSDYGYDALDRLKSEAGPGVDQNFDYDANGNRLSDGTNSYTLAPNGNRIQKINGVTVTYDPAGNLLDDGQGRTFTYNAAGRLKEVRVNDTLVASYKYDYRGRRTHQITPQGTTLYHYDARGHLIQTSDAQGIPQQSLHWADDQPIAQVDHGPGGDQIVYLHTDRLNTPRSATDANRTVVWRWEGAAFGNTLPEEDVDGDGVPTVINLRFAGMYSDSETGLYYNGHRYYDPRIGRYISSDPIGLAGGLNTYSYVGNNPLRWIDPLGLWSPGGHDALYNYAFIGILDPSEIAIIQQESRALDISTGIGVSTAYIHSMREPFQSAQAAKAASKKYICDKLKQARGESSRTQALKDFADAAHTITDSFSPEHTDSSGNPRLWFPLLFAGHSWNENHGHETAHDITSDIYGKATAALINAYNEAFSGVSSNQGCGCQ